MTPSPAGAPTSTAFTPLYESKRSRHLPEEPGWHTHAATDARVGQAWKAWADVLIDFRLPWQQTPLPGDLTASAGDPMEWPSQAPGWRLAAWNWLGEAATPEGHTDPPVRDGHTVALFTDPDGFRFALAVSQERSGGLAHGRLSILFPTMRFLFLGGFLPVRADDGQDPGARPVASKPLALDGFANRSQTYSLETLRDAVRDPAGWFTRGGLLAPGEDWQRVDPGAVTTTTPQLGHPTAVVCGSVSPARLLLTWAAGGYYAYTLAVAARTAAGIDAAEWGGWLDDGWAGDDVLPWFTVRGAGRKNRNQARAWYEAGMTTDQARRWEFLGQTLAVDAALAGLVREFEDAGWEPEHAQAMLAAVRVGARVGTGRSRWLPTTAALQVVREWLFLPGEVAVGYQRAGYTLAEARAFEDAGRRVPTEALAMLGSLRHDAVGMG